MKTKTLNQKLIDRLAWLAILILGGAIIALSAHGAETNAPPAANPPGESLTNAMPVWSNPTLQAGFQQMVDAAMSATNYGVAVYGTYAPKAPTKIGGGVLGVYNINDYAGLGLGVDWLGQFSLLSVNLQLKLPVQPFRTWTSYPAWVQSIKVIPLAIVGTGKPFTGGGNGVATLWDTGGLIKFGHLFKGQFGVGATWGAWDNAGDYSGHRYHAFLSWSKGF